ncbi:alpha/beta hydrolase [uncultured Hyphomonas sp.]|uniref:alpha/beta fold hydrolase n=1 Tax=uncultured Hyphomonas sp. TaxID=225298 RepID=UPI002AAB5EC0|nr:alpha/beta hydrolase [uncultured Hyphomonas sp.]
MLTATAITLAGLGAAVGLSSGAYTSRIHKTHPASGRRVEVGGYGVHVLEAGKAGPPVLMIHGASANAREFTWTLAPPLDQDFRVLMADRPGHGHSRRPPGAETLAVQAAQMAGVLEKLAPDEPAVIVGHSFGGAVALRLALDRPELVKGLVLLAPVTHDWGGEGQAWYNRFAASRLIGPAFSQVVPLVGPSQVGAGIGGVFDPSPAPEDYFEKSGIGLLFRPASFRANARDVRVLDRELAAQSKRYGELAMPITVFSGSKDTVITPAKHTARLKKQADIDLRILPEEGHMPHHNHGQDVADAIRRLASLPGSR